MNTPKHGQAFGCTDTSPPRDCTPYQLSRLLDAMRNAKAAGLNENDVFKIAPDSMKLEFNYSKWKYEVAK